MTIEMTMILSLIGLLLVWIASPLLPAVLIYKLFPDTNVAVSGPLSGLTLKAGGAFAAYLITLLITMPLTNKIFNTTGSFLKPVWTITAPILAIDQGKMKNKELNMKGSSVSFDPLDYGVHDSMEGDKITFKVAGAYLHDWPKIVVQIPQHGGKVVDLKDYEGSFEVDDYEKTVKIHQPIIVSKVQTGGFGI